MNKGGFSIIEVIAASIILSLCGMCSFMSMVNATNAVTRSSQSIAIGEVSNTFYNLAISAFSNASNTLADPDNELTALDAMFDLDLDTISQEDMKLYYSYICSTESTSMFNPYDIEKYDPDSVDYDVEIDLIKFPKELSASQKVDFSAYGIADFTSYDDTFWLAMYPSAYGEEPFIKVGASEFDGHDVSVAIAKVEFIYTNEDTNIITASVKKYKVIIYTEGLSGKEVKSYDFYPAIEE